MPPPTTTSSTIGRIADVASPQSAAGGDEGGGGATPAAAAAGGGGTQLRSKVVIGSAADQQAKSIKTLERQMGEVHHAVRGITQMLQAVLERLPEPPEVAEDVEADDP